MDKQTLHGIFGSEKMIIDIQEWIDGIEFTIFGSRGGIQGEILVDKKEFGAALEEMYEQFVELPF